MPVAGSRLTVLGFDDNGGAGGIPRQDQIHTGIFGEVGSGKSTINTIMVSQNIRRGEGFLVLDPHGSLAQDVLRMVPDGQQDRVVYISLDSVVRWGRTVKINPLEVREGEERYVIAMNLVNALRNIYHDSWGPQLESLLRNGANALVEIEGSTLRDLVKIITDERSRAVTLNRVANRDVKHFWSVLFPEQYKKDSGRAAYNKLDKILSIPQIAAMFDAPKSTIDFAEILESGRWVVIDLSSGGSDDVRSFVGTVLINMVYVEARKRFGRNASDQRPFFVYIDEAHLFAPFVLRELLNTMRKANVKVTVTSQTVNAFPRDIAREISALVRTVACFKVDTETAGAFRTVMPVPPEVLTSMTQGRFAFYSQGDPPISGVLRALPIVDRSRDWEGLARRSTEKNGEATSLEKYMLPTKDAGESPKVTPLEGMMLLHLYNEGRDMTRDEIFGFARRNFEVDQRDVLEKLEDVLVGRLGYVERRTVKAGDGDGNLSTRYSLSAAAYRGVFSRAAAGRRAGSDVHLGTIFMIMDLQLKNYKFCIPDLGDSQRQRPDLLIFEPRGAEGQGGSVPYDPYYWSDKVIAVEVETDPAKHEQQVVKNYMKNFDLGYDVWFVVFSAKHEQFIVDLMARNRIEKKDYKIAVVERQQLEPSDSPGGMQSSLSREELEVQRALGSGAVPRVVAERAGLSSYDVMGLLWKLEKKGLAERGFAETRGTAFGQAGGNAAGTKREEYYVPTEEGKKLFKAQPVPDKPPAASPPSGGSVQEGYDLESFSDRALKELVTHKVLGSLAQKILEYRGYRVKMGDGPPRIRKRW